MSGKSQRKRQITIETHSVTIIRLKGKSNSAFCELCQEMVKTFSIEQIAEILEMELDEIIRQIKLGEFHLTTAARTKFICGNSLSNEKK